MSAIKEYQHFYIIHLKNWETIEISEEIYSFVKNRLVNSDKSFYEIWENIYNKFEIVKVVKSNQVTDIYAYILQQPKQIRDKIKSYAVSNSIQRNSIDHVSNVVKAINDWKI